MLILVTLHSMIEIIGVNTFSFLYTLRSLLSSVCLSNSNLSRALKNLTSVFLGSYLQAALPAPL